MNSSSPCARRLTRLIRPSDTLARMSGDEFIILCEDLKDPSNVELLVQRIHDALDHPFDLAGVQVNVSASVGVAYAGRGEDMSDAADPARRRRDV